MAQAHQLQTSFASGVLSPKMFGRPDIRQYYQALSVGDNIVIEPLGGARRRPGFQYLATLPNNLTDRHTAATATATNGGTAANGKDEDPTTVVLTTNNISTTNPYVVLHYDLGAAYAIDFVHVIGLSITAGTSGQFTVGYSTDNVSWTNLPIEQVTTTAASTYRYFALGSVTARYWRVARVGATDLGTATASLAGLELWTNSSTVSPVRLVPFFINSTTKYMLAFTDRCISVYSGSSLLQVVESPYEGADLAEIDFANSVNQMVLVHEDYPPQVLTFDQSLFWTFQLDRATFTNVPQYDFNDDDSPALTAEVQTITFNGGAWKAGDTFQIDVEGARTGPITYAGVGSADEQSSTAANIAKAVQKLYAVGFSGVSCVYTSGTTFTLTLGEDSARDYELFAGTPLSGDDTNEIAFAKTTSGVARTEDLWSETRGYPRTVCFYAGRLYFGGTRSLPQCRVASVVRDFFNFDLGDGLEDEAIFDAPYDSNWVQALFAGRSLQVFTTNAEMREINRVPTPETFFPTTQTQYGSAKIRPVTVDGATLFIQSTRKVLRDFIYSNEEDAYNSAPLSSLAAHLLSGVVSIAAWQGSSSEDANLVFIVNDDGTAAVMATLRSQDFTAFSRWTTDGLIKDIGVVDQDRYVAVQRTINGTNYLYMELMDDEFYLDAAKQMVWGVGFESSSITTVSHLNGEECRVRADGFVLDNVTPSGGTATATAEGVAFPAALIEIGLNWVPRMTTMPLNQDFGNGYNFLRKSRVVKVRMLVHESMGITMNGRQLPDRYWDLDNFDEAAEPFSGMIELEETTNWDAGPKTQTISQEDPLPFHILALDITVESA